MTPDPTPQPHHGSAGFCTDHAQAGPRGVWLNSDGSVTSPVPSNTASSATMFPRTDPRIEAARAEALRRWPGQSDAGWVRHGYVLGFTDAIAALDDAWDDAQDDAIVPAPDARTETVARLTETVARVIGDARWGPGEWLGVPDRHLLGEAAAVVAALDDETARLREEVERLEQSLVNARGACGDFMRSGDAARAALDRVRALADGPDHRLILSAEPERTEVRMDGSSPYGLRYTGKIGAVALVYQTPVQAERLRASLAVQPHVTVADLRAALDPEADEAREEFWFLVRNGVEPMCAGARVGRGDTWVEKRLTEGLAEVC